MYFTRFQWPWPFFFTNFTLCLQNLCQHRTLTWVLSLRMDSPFKSSAVEHRLPKASLNSLALIHASSCGADERKKREVLVRSCTDCCLAFPPFSRTNSTVKAQTLPPKKYIKKENNNKQKRRRRREALLNSPIPCKIPSYLLARSSCLE